MGFQCENRKIVISRNEKHVLFWPKGKNAICNGTPAPAH